ncbi:f-boxlrr-repeat protein, partial [Nicotiana attenuata]
RTATAEILPECLIHKILSYLEYEEAAKMSILSKTWLQAWLTHPNLLFRLYSEQDVKIIDQILERYGDTKTPIYMFECSIYYRRYDFGKFFPLIDTWLTVALNNGVKYLAYRDYLRSPSYPLSIVRTLAAKSLRELDLEGCDLMRVSLSTSNVINCNSLRKLSLHDVHLDDKMFQILFASCPLIVNIVIHHCVGLTEIEVRNLQKVKSVSIKTKKNQCVTIQAPTLEYLSYNGFSKESSMLDIVECWSLKSLELSCERISDGFLEHLIFRSQFLESLILNSLSIGLESINLCGSQSIKFLKILACEGIREIDAPNLVTLEYMGSQIPKLKLAKESSQLKHSKLFLYCRNNILNNAWFCELKKFLSNSTSWSEVTLKFYQRNEINRKELQLLANPQLNIYPQVDVLDVEIYLTRECPAFLDALLWSCHPTKLNLSSTYQMITCFIDHLLYWKN